MAATRANIAGASARTILLNLLTSAEGRRARSIIETRLASEQKGERERERGE